MSFNYVFIKYCETFFRCLDLLFEVHVVGWMLKQLSLALAGKQGRSAFIFPPFPKPVDHPMPEIFFATS